MRKEDLEKNQNMRTYKNLDPGGEERAEEGAVPEHGARDRNEELQQVQWLDRSEQQEVKLS